MPSLAVDSPPTATPGACAPDEGRVRRVIAGLFFVIVLPGIVMMMTAMRGLFEVFFWSLQWGSLDSFEPLPLSWRPWIMAFLWAVYLASIVSWTGWLLAERLAAGRGVVGLLLTGAVTCCGGLWVLTGVMVLLLLVAIHGMQMLFYGLVATVSGPWNFFFLIMHSFIPLILGLFVMGLAVLAPFGGGITLWQTALRANHLHGGGMRVGAVCGFMLALASVATLTLVFC